MLQLAGQHVPSVLHRFAVQGRGGVCVAIVSFHAQVSIECLDVGSDHHCCTSFMALFSVTPKKRPIMGVHVSIWNGVITIPRVSAHHHALTRLCWCATTSHFNVTVTCEMSPFGPPPCDSDLGWGMSAWGEVQWDRRQVQTCGGPGWRQHTVQARVRLARVTTSFWLVRPSPAAPLALKKI